MVKSARVVCSKNAILLPWTIATDPYVCPAYKQTNKRRTRAEIKSTDDEKKKTEERRNKKRTGKHKKEPRGETSASFIIAVVYRPARTKPLPSQAPPFFPFFCPLLLKLPSLHESLLFLLAAWNTSSFFTSFFFFFISIPGTVLLTHRHAIWVCAANIAVPKWWRRHSDDYVDFSLSYFCVCLHRLQTNRRNGGKKKY